MGEHAERNRVEEPPEESGSICAVLEARTGCSIEDLGSLELTYIL
jgi:hypothetical protein